MQLTCVECCFYADEKVLVKETFVEMDDDTMESVIEVVKSKKPDEEEIVETQGGSGGKQLGWKPSPSERSSTSEDDDDEESGGAEDEILPEGGGGGGGEGGEGDGSGGGGGDDDDAEGGGNDDDDDDDDDDEEEDDDDDDEEEDDDDDEEDDKDDDDEEEDDDDSEVDESEDDVGKKSEEEEEVEVMNEEVVEEESKEEVENMQDEVAGNDESKEENSNVAAGTEEHGEPGGALVGGGVAGNVGGLDGRLVIYDSAARSAEMVDYENLQPRKHLQADYEKALQVVREHQRVNLTNFNPKFAEALEKARKDQDERARIKLLQNARKVGLLANHADGSDEDFDIDMEDDPMCNPAEWVKHCASPQNLLDHLELQLESRNANYRKNRNMPPKLLGEDLIRDSILNVVAHIGAVKDDPEKVVALHGKKYRWVVFSWNSVL